ncbi:LysR family transcriptional regulator, chromosome initiation inhibitor [Paracoccus isoporae]|uniref:LysR family transcriptional regulator, chromosome initiation inhibitor n=1 Tax=Paracoccus isoporae TaxID=591205 RepID=A0A1G7EA05_9RHOB|nr:LysR family transcriptional regulator ArgP [Paracoccus isoporae]SDE60477.1 LysR family transcriptional regulator, chromosome initiation inhibitor [Paracoccus isoporae]
MLDYPALAALAEIARRGSFEAAALALGITQPAVSQRIKSLEARVGQILLDRGPPVMPTAAGLRLIAHVDQVRLLEQEIAGAAGADTGAATIRIAVNADSLASWAVAALAAAPGLLDLVIDDQDHAETWLRAGLVSAAITSQSKPIGGCDSHKLGAMRYVACATPDFIARHFADGVTAEALPRAPAITFNSKDDLQNRWVRQQTGRPIALLTHLIPTSEGFAQAVRLGMGWGMNPLLMVRDDLRAGRLRPLVPDAELSVPLSWQIARIMVPAMAPLTRAIRAAARDALDPP